MKKKWTNNLGFKILSVAIAFLLWVVIINIEDPTISRTFRVQVDIQNDDIVASGGKVYKITEGEYVEVTVKGNKSFVDSLTDADITATAITVIIFVIKVRPLLKSKVMDDDLVIMK